MLFFLRVGAGDHIPPLFYTLPQPSGLQGKPTNKQFFSRSDLRLTLLSYHVLGHLDVFFPFCPAGSYADRRY